MWTPFGVWAAMGGASTLILGGSKCFFAGCR